ncbi:MAG: hypothetical protein OER87_09745 [Gammaproteobacteria bacterium]|nr:hypothetical protein [Gammaproteobacteria bacterium]
MSPEYGSAGEVPLQVIGAGPAGIGLVLALCNRVAAAGDAALPERRILDDLQIYEAGPSPGGKMAHYRINANTSSPDVVQGIQDGNPFVDIRDRYLAHPETQSRLIALPRVGELMVEPLAARFSAYLGERLHCNLRVALIEAGERKFSSFDADGNLLTRSRNLLLCCGASDQPLPALRPYLDRWEGSDRFLRRDKLDDLPARDGPIVIVGASHSAFSCAWRLLHDPLFADLARDREIVILQRRERVKLRGSREFAREHDIAYDPHIDVCPQTGIVFFNGGLRKDAKMLYLKIRDGDETRVRMQRMYAVEAQQELLGQAGLILQATGFAPSLPRIERDGRVLQVGNPTERGELHDLERNRIIDGLYGMGLGWNILPAGRDRGEASFHGGIHGFQSYPLVVAPQIIDQLVKSGTMETMN